MILYLHGFRSSPQSFKARLLAERLARAGLEHLWRCPQLPASPRAAIALAERIMAGVDPADLTLIGSSLGGFYATWLAEKYGCRAVLLNPATHPARDLHRYLGEQPLWHGKGTIFVEPAFLGELQALSVPSIKRPECYFLLAATGDEVLDYREMLAHYAGVATTLIDGSDHGIAEFAHYVDAVLAFCGVAPFRGAA